MNPSKRSSYVAVLVAVALVAFVSGLRTGATTIDLAGVATSVDNKTEGQAEGVDFAPFWKAWSVIDDRFVGTTTDAQRRVYGAIEGMTAALGDPYTMFFPPAEAKSFAEQISGNFEGVGMEIGQKDGRLVVVAPIKGSPAEKAGMQPGDFILDINGQESSGMATEQAVTLIRGKAGTTVTLTVSRDGVEQPFKVSIVRAKIDVPTVKTEEKGDVFVISLYSFTANSANLFRNALKEFIDSGHHKLVLDLRGNPGGYLDAAVDMASWFLPSGATIVREDFGKGREERVLRSKGFDIFTDKLRMVVLVDGGSASASEILAGALSENGKAELVGVKTFGKGSVQELVPITDDTSLKVTIARWLTPNGHSISQQGIVPEHVVERTQADVAAQKDPQMEKALQLLK